MVDAPHYCCAILRLSDGRFLCERRPVGASRAPGRITCFGGHREAGEEPLDCLLRELAEETGWQPPPAACERAVILRVGDELEAWFYRIDAVPPLAELRSEPGFGVALVAEDELDAPGFSAWHRAVLKAWLRGELKVVIG